MTVKEFLKQPCTVWNGTWREWFKDLILTLLEQTEAFRGKRPNCNSGWELELVLALSQVKPEIVLNWEYDEERRVPYEIDRAVYRNLCKEVVNCLMDERE
jgi:hypothetical protein